MTPFPASVTAAFVALTVAIVALWAPQVSRASRAHQLWMVPGGLALVLGSAGGLIDLTAALLLLTFAGMCAVTRLVTRQPLAVLAHVLVLVTCAALFLHVVPGFDNPRLIAGAITGPDAQPYTKYLNFDKGMAGLLLLGLYVPGRTNADQGIDARTFLWRFATIVGAVIVVTLAAGYVRWDPKVPEWWASWLWSMVFLTALPEEALFRGCAQTWIAERLKGTRGATPASIVIAGLLFGLTHAGGGPTYVMLASVAGIGYGWIYATTGSISAAVSAHAGLNTVHLLCFTYPALSAAARGF